MNYHTLCARGCVAPDDTGAVSVPIYQSSTFSHPGVGQSSGYDYSRLQNPTREALEKTAAALEHGVDAMAFSSGMAAIAAAMELFRPGDHIIASDDLYGGSHRLFHSINQKNGLTFDFTDTSDLASVEALIRPETRALFVETPTNPMMHITDLQAISGLAKARGLLLMVDNTFLTPYLQNPIDFGADLVLHSGTKYLGGHNDTLAGILVTASVELSERLRFLYKTTGACLSPFDSWLLLRGIKTLPVRMDRQQETAGTLAAWLLGQPKVNRVLYPGLVDHPGFSVSGRQSRGPGAMISFELESSASARRVLERVRLILFAESLGGVETLITYPMMQTHADVPPKQREARGINERLLRLSVGLEYADDLIADLDQALSQFDS